VVYNIADMKSILLGLILALVLTGCRGSSSPTQAPTRLPPTPANTVLQDDYAIYAALLPEPIVAFVAYAIQQTTALRFDGLTMPAGLLPALLADTLSNFLRGEPAELPTRYGLQRAEPVLCPGKPRRLLRKANR
jgi:hypothetical protein